MRRMRSARELDNDTRTEFLTMVSHELRTPLTSVVGFVDTLLRFWDSMSDEQRLQYLRVIEQQGARMTHAIDEVLTVAEVGQRLRNLAPRAAGQAVDIPAVLTRVATATSDAIHLLHAAGELNACCVEADLEVILHHLFSNALRHGEPPVLAFATRRGAMIIVSVVDNGPGVPERFRERMFEPGMQGRLHLEGGGLGLGLSIARALARAQGGDLWYEDAQAGGSCFRLSLPAVKP